MKYINVFITMLFPLALIASTNTFHFAFEDTALTNEAKTFITNDLSLVLAPGLDYSTFTVPCQNPETMQQCKADINWHGGHWRPTLIKDKVQHILQMPDGKEAIWVTSEVSGIYTNKMAEIAANPEPFDSFKAITSRFQRLNKEPLTDAEFEQTVLFSSRNRPIDVNGDLFSKVWNNDKTYAPSVLWVTRVEEKNYPQIKRGFEAFELPDPDKNGYLEYWGFLIITGKESGSYPVKTTWGYLNNRWYLFLQ